MAEYAIQIVFLHLAWIFRLFTEEDGEDTEKVSKLVEKRDKAKHLFYNLALRERTNAAESVRRQVSILILFFAFKLMSRPSSLTSTCTSCFRARMPRCFPRPRRRVCRCLTRINIDLEESMLLARRGICLIGKNKANHKVSERLTFCGCRAIPLEIDKEAELKLL